MVEKFEWSGSFILVFCSATGMLFSRKSEHDGVTVYHGHSAEKETSGQFVEKCIQALTLLKRVDPSSYEQFAARLGRIKTTFFYTRPVVSLRVLEVNERDARKMDVVSLGGAIVSETLMMDAYIGGANNSNNLNQLREDALQKEIWFRERAKGEQMANLEIVKLRNSKYWSLEKKITFLNEWSSPSNWWALPVILMLFNISIWVH